jgi:hypothetical protein
MGKKNNGDPDRRGGPGVKILVFFRAAFLLGDGSV